jgi:hypothetical protein
MTGMFEIVNPTSVQAAGGFYTAFLALALGGFGLVAARRLRTCAG